MEAAKYTFHKDPGTESQLNSILSRIRKDLLSLPSARLLEAVLLGGGYGGGEGGVTLDVTRNIYHYNDFFFFPVVICGLSRRTCEILNRELQTVARNWAEKLQTEVEIDFPRSRAECVDMANTRLMQDLRAGSLALTGDPDILKDIPRVPPDRLPDEEALRLLVTHGIGLFGAIAYAPRAAELRTVDHLHRKVNKAILACGDAMLIVSGRYVPSAEARFAALKQLIESGISLFCDAEMLLAAYRDALNFQYSPHFVMAATLNAKAESARDLWRATFLFFVSKLAGQEVFTGERALAFMCHSHFYAHSSFRCFTESISQFLLPGQRNLFLPPRLRVVLDLGNALFDDRNVLTETETDARFHRLETRWKNYFLHGRAY